MNDCALQQEGPDPLKILQTAYLLCVVDVERIHSRWPFIIQQIPVGWNSRRHVFVASEFC